MMKVNSFEPCSSLNWLVKKFFTIEVSGNTRLIDKFIPRQDSPIVFHFKSLPHIIEPVYAKLKPFFLAPLIVKENTLEITGDLNTFIIMCYPSVFSRIFNINMTPRPALSIDLPSNIFYPLWNQLSNLSNTIERISTFSAFIENFLPCPYCPDEIDKIYHFIVNKCITTPLSEILHESNIGTRSIQQRFIKRIGVSPKALARVVRVNYLWDKIKNESAIDYQDLVFEGNYCDQAHFIKDFKAITGETPRHFFSRNLDNVKMLSGK